LQRLQRLQPEISGLVRYHTYWGNREPNPIRYHAILYTSW